jgi:hypothetical protein
MADDLASILVRNQLDGKEPSWQSPLAPVGSAQMSQWEWAKNHPTLANFLATGLMGLGAMRSRAGGDRATGAVLDAAARRKGDYGPDIMRGGMADVMANELGGMRPAADPAPYYPARQDRPLPANTNIKDARVNNPYMDAHIQQQWQRYVQRPDSSPPEITPIGKAEFDATRFLTSANGNVAEARAIARELGAGADVFRALDRYAKPSMTVLPGGKE